MSIKINFLKFQDFSELIEDKDDYFIEVMTEKTFGIKAEELVELLQDKPFKHKYNYNLSFEKAGRFIDLDTLVRENNFREFFNLVIEKKYFWQKIDLDSISLTEGKFIVSKFHELINPIKEYHEWIYNPPYSGGGGEMTQGAVERQEFTEHYGGYIELVYLLSNGNPLNFNQVYEMNTNEFLFLGEYLLRKKYTESIK